jgi:hypothetical protein
VRDFGLKPSPHNRTQPNAKQDQSHQELCSYPIAGLSLIGRRRSTTGTRSVRDRPRPGKRPSAAAHTAQRLHSASCPARSWTKVLQQAREALRLVPNDPGWLATQQQAQSQLAQKAPVALPSQKKRQANMKGAFQPTNEYKQTWIFQANPTVWHGFHEYFKQQTVGATSDWTVSRYRKKMQPGDRVLLWETGSRGGLLAIGELTEEPFQQEPSTKRSDEQVKPVWTVRFQYTHFLEEPIQRSTFKKTKVLQDMLHIRVPQGSNFKVTEEEWKVLQKLINQQP